MNKKKIQVFIFASMTSIILAILITYKITNPSIPIPTPKIKEYPVSSSKYIKQQREILNGITNNFNNQNQIDKYINNQVKVKAKTAGNTIIVDYEADNTKEQFTLILDDQTLSINIPENKKNIFNNIFKLIIASNQQRLGNNNDLSSFFSKYYKENMLTSAVIISKNNESIEYIINTNKIIK